MFNSGRSCKRSKQTNNLAGGGGVAVLWSEFDTTVSYLSKFPLKSDLNVQQRLRVSESFPWLVDTVVQVKSRDDVAFRLLWNIFSTWSTISSSSLLLIFQSVHLQFPLSPPHPHPSLPPVPHYYPPNPPPPQPPPQHKAVRVLGMR